MYNQKRGDIIEFCSADIYHSTAEITQHQIQSLHILALDNAELNEFLENEYSENPLMEYFTAKQSPINCSASSKDHSIYPEIVSKDPDTLLNFFF